MYINTNNAINNVSQGTQTNRILDRLGYPEGFGDAIGALIDLKAGDVSGAFRNLVDLNSGLSTSQMDRIFSGPAPALGRGFIPRCGFSGPHLEANRFTYAVREQVGERAHIGQRYGFNWGPFQLQGQISGQQYNGSFAKPIKLANGDYLYRGRTYDNMNSIWKDGRDGRIDGQATTYRTGLALRPAFPSFCFPPVGAQANNPFGPGGLAGALGSGQNLFDLVGKIFGNGNGANGANGSNGANGANGGSNELSSILSNPNLSLEDKLGVLMAKLSEHLDKQIEGKMQEISKAMQAEQSGGAAKKSGESGGLFGKIAGGIGAAFGGPIGGTIGSAIGGLFGGGSGSGSGGASGADGQKPNLQLLQTQLQQLVEKRTQMFQTMTSILKSLHETSLSTIRNLKA